ncbi:MAG: metal dependent phosphohydrolase [Actinomycetia bacterium]|nr:metal dependent phosphohydrolase [Actinomycetes bacterium]
MSSVETPAAIPHRTNELGTELVARARMRARRNLSGSEGLIAVVLAGAFLATAAGAAVFLPPVRHFSPAAAVVAVVAYAAVSRVRFEVSNMWVLPTQLVLVPMLFTLPPRSVPLLVAAGLLLSKLPDFARGTFAPSKAHFSLVDAWHSVGPVLVLSLAAAGAPSWTYVPLYLGALAAQFGADFIPGAIWSHTAFGVSLVEHARSMRVAFLVDAALAPVGLVVAIAAGERVWAVLVVLPLVVLLQVFARERQVRIDHALELGHAYRGTAMLLGDVIEADDEYTGAHSRDVVGLVVGVADRLGLDPKERQRAEFAALLHDVGKVKIPPDIINKPGPLDNTERALMNTHTIVGQTMLEQIGGLLGDVGGIVRSCHEHWDGGGYPDGLAGEAIPFEARIVCACDAWSAMTTDRAYRKALPVGLALAELHACAGTQFDPRVVDALVAVLDL